MVSIVDTNIITLKQVQLATVHTIKRHSVVNGRGMRSQVLSLKSSFDLNKQTMRFQSKMARNEADREDLMQEAVSLVRRIEFQSELFSEPLMAGFNSQGWLFVYLGNDLMYRFDEQGRLRRSFVDGWLYRTQGQTLAVMVRERVFKSGDPIESNLMRQDLSDEQLETFRLQMHANLVLVTECLRAGVVTRQHPAEMSGIADEVEGRIQQVLNSKEFLAPAIVRR